MKNLKRTKNAQIQVPLPVPDGIEAGQCCKLGDAGLRGLLITARSVPDTNYQMGGAVGVPEGFATCELIGVHTTVTVSFPAAVARFAPVYCDPDGDYTTVEAGNTKVGCTLEPLAGAGKAEVALF